MLSQKIILMHYDSAVFSTLYFMMDSLDLILRVYQARIRYR
jgi:hypothetical protein